MQVEPHIIQTLAKLTDAELRELAGQMLARLVALEGSAFTGMILPVIGKNWVDPFGTGWKPYE
jgi:hypothetical protein